MLAFEACNVGADVVSDQSNAIVLSRDGANVAVVAAPSASQKHYSDERIKWIVSRSLASFFLEFTPEDSRIEAVLWSFEGPTLRIWTVLNHPDPELQSAIYEAELKFLDKLPDVPSDFSVLYRHDRRLEDIKPGGAHLVTR